MKWSNAACEKKIKLNEKIVIFWLFCPVKVKEVYNFNWIQTKNQEFYKFLAKVYDFILK